MWKWIAIGFGALLVILIGLFIWAYQMMQPSSLNLLRDDPQAVRKLDLWFTEMSTDELPKFNGVVYIRRGNEVLLRKGYGQDSQGRTLTADSPLRLASVSKQFTAVGILTLVRDGLVDLEAPLSTYLPDCQFGEMPVESLLNHTSAIPDVYMQRAGEDLLTIEGVERLVCDGQTRANPAAGYSYNNTAYVLLARLIETVSGQSFEDYMQAAIFNPLDMKNSRVWNLVSTRPFPERAGGFDMHSKDKTPIEPGSLDGVAGDGGVFSTLNDLENWDRFWEDERLLPRVLKEKAMTAGLSNYGYGLIIKDDIVWHNGSWLAARTFMRRNRRTGDLIILLDNGQSLALDSIAAELTIFLGD